MHALEIGVVPEDLVCDVFGDAFVDIHCALLGYGELVRLLLLRLLFRSYSSFSEYNIRGTLSPLAGYRSTL